MSIFKSRPIEIIRIAIARSFIEQAVMINAFTKRSLLGLMIFRSAAGNWKAFYD